MSDEEAKPTEIFKRKIRSFVRREGRLTVGQQRALDDLYPQWGVGLQKEAYDFAEIFGNNNPVVFEIGFGNGASLLEQAKAEPEKNFFGLEVHRPGTGALMLGIEEFDLKNIRCSYEDATEVVEQCVAENSLSRIQIYFPDPWHKKKHNKRRIIQTPFVAQLAKKLKGSGLLHLATDWQAYAEHMADVMQASDDFVSEYEGAYAPSRPAWRPQTKFETRGQRLGHDVWDLVYKRK